MSGRLAGLMRHLHMGGVGRGSGTSNRQLPEWMCRHKKQSSRHSLPGFAPPQKNSHCSAAMSSLLPSHLQAPGSSFCPAPAPAPAPQMDSDRQGRRQKGKYRHKCGHAHSHEHKQGHVHVHGHRRGQGTDTGGPRFATTRHTHGSPSQGLRQSPRSRSPQPRKRPPRLEPKLRRRRLQLKRPRPKPPRPRWSERPVAAARPRRRPPTPHSAPRRR